MAHEIDSIDTSKPASESSAEIATLTQGRAMDCVLSYHMNPLTCGVAKFNLKLARQLGVSMHQVLDPIVTTYRAPVLSMKMSEFGRADVGRLGELLAWVEWREC